jgi:hypothetical protein
MSKDFDRRNSQKKKVHAREERSAISGTGDLVVFAWSQRRV